VAVLLRIFFALIITWLFNVPFLKVVGALLLVWIGVKLLVGEEEGGGEHVEASDTLWRAVRTIAIADAVMSLDNVLAIAAASHGNVWLFVFGLVVSIPLIILGAQLIMGIIERFPAFIWLGAGLLGWIAGEMLVDDPVVLGQVAAMMPSLTVTQIGAAATSLKAGAFLHYGAAFVGAAIVLAIGWWKRRPRHGDVSVR
jgi:YjbE family integral membrane protein